MTARTKIERRTLVRGIATVSGAAISSTLLPKHAAAQTANPSASASDHFERAEIKIGDNTIFIRRYGSGSPLLYGARVSSKQPDVAVCGAPACE